MVVAENKQVNTQGGKVLTGEVVSDKMDKTIVVKVVRMLKHPFWGKVVRRHKKYKVHDEQNAAKIGDTVEFKECRPLSKEKYMTLVRVIPKS